MPYKIDDISYGIYNGNRFFHCTICQDYEDTEMWICIHCCTHFTNKKTWKRHIGPYTGCSMHATDFGVVNVITT